MLSAADAALADRDAALPALRLLLDDDAFTAALRELYPAGGVRRAQARYVRYKRGTSCLVAFDVETDAGATSVYARGHEAGDQAKVEKAARHPGAPGVLGGGVAALPGAPLVVFPFPNDHELPALAARVDDEQREAMREKLVPERPALGGGTLETLRHKPERRYVGRLSSADDAGVVLRLYAPAEYAGLRETARIFESRGPLRIPAHLGGSKRYRAVAVEWLAGTPLREALAAGGVSGRTGETIGAALAELHAQRSKRIRVTHTAEEHVRALADAAEAVAALAPELAARALRLAATIGERLVRRRWRGRSAIHGDLSADQIVLQDDRAAIVDFDRAAQGDPRMDLGTFHARLIVDAVCGVIAQARAETLFRSVLDAYRAASPKDMTRRVSRFTASALLLSAVEPFRLRHEDWPGRIATLLDLSETLAARKGTGGA